MTELLGLSGYCLIEARDLCLDELERQLDSIEETFQSSHKARVNLGNLEAQMVTSKLSQFSVETLEWASAVKTPWIVLRSSFRARLDSEPMEANLWAPEYLETSLCESPRLAFLERSPAEVVCSPRDLLAYSALTRRKEKTYKSDAEVWIGWLQPWRDSESRYGHHKSRKKYLFSKATMVVIDGKVSSFCWNAIVGSTRIV
ncbi:GL11743 [Drosophila persimilis]|uniref:GL11743 n=1 Tax=Drosophila persimilis TaxID=7234 RepID=B4IRA1_DROPE|nr:GL11743 [Drosophila persimilis]